jgi:hypothetical protein
MGLVASATRPFVFQAIPGFSGRPRFFGPPPVFRAIPGLFSTPSLRQDFVCQFYYWSGILSAIEHKIGSSTQFMLS